MCIQRYVFDLQVWSSFIIYLLTYFILLFHFTRYLKLNVKMMAGGMNNFLCMGGDGIKLEESIFVAWLA